MKLEKLEKDHYYHIFNRGINSSIIFQNEDNMAYFLSLIDKHLIEKVNILAYCLMNNHFHLIVKIIEEESLVSQAFSNLLNAYAKAFNKQQNRTGSLFEKHFRRKRLVDESYLINSIIYVHNNPVNHNLVKSPGDYLFSSYNNYLSKDNSISISDENEILRLFDSIDNFEVVHKQKNNLDLDLQGFENLAGNEIKEQNDKLNLQGLKDLVGFSMKDKFYEYIQILQDSITSGLEAIDGKATFQEDVWKRPEGGGGRTRVIENGNVFEKGGVNISGVHGKLPKSMQTYFNVGDVDFFACGLSLVLHPKNPMVPTVHANWRYFEMYDKDKNIIDSWFGGGQDLTPYYLFDEDAIHFHQTCKTACDKHNPQFYPDYKKRCDDYFYNVHRNEGRGIGGLFFDYCKASEGMTMENWYNFVTEVGDSFLEAYVPIVEKRKELPYTEAERSWQEIRRGRYVEFNLVHDKGTLFGLKTNGRIESILMSLPPHVQWVYNHHPEKGSEEEKLLKVLKNPVDWINKLTQ